MGRGAIFRRLLLVPPTLFGVAVVVFVLLRVVPGNPVAMMIPPGASQADVDRLMAQYGLDLPIFDQFVVWLQQVAVGDFGTSISRRQDVMTLILARLPATLELVLIAILIATVLGALLPWMIVAAVIAIPAVPLLRRHRRKDATPSPAA